MNVSEDVAVFQLSSPVDVTKKRNCTAVATIAVRIFEDCRRFILRFYFCWKRFSEQADRV